MSQHFSRPPKSRIELLALFIAFVSASIRSEIGIQIWSFYWWWERRKNFQAEKWQFNSRKSRHGIEGFGSAKPSLFWEPFFLFRERRSREVWLWFMMILLWLPVCRQRGGPYNIVAAIWAPSLRALHYHFDAWFSETTFSLRGLAESGEVFGFDLNSLSESCFVLGWSKCNKGVSARIILETVFFLQCAIIMDFGALVIRGN